MTTCKCIAILLVSFALFVFLLSLSATLQVLPITIDNAIAREGTETRGVLAAEARRATDEVLKVVIAQAPLWRRDLTAPVQSLSGGIVDILRVRTEPVAAVAADASKLLETYRQIPSDVAAELKPLRPLWDMRNPASYPIQGLGLLGGVRHTAAEAARTASAVRTAAPAMIESIQQAADSASALAEAGNEVAQAWRPQVVEAAKKKRPWYSPARWILGR